MVNDMIERLRNLNPDIDVYSIKDEAFKQYGRVLDICTTEIVNECGKIQMPETGTEYMLSVNSLEKLECSETIRELAAGGCEAQIGICMGHNSFMNALEFHKSSEINIAATPLVLLLGLEYEMEKTEYNSYKLKAFYLEKGDIAEVYGTTLHFCPCQVSDDGFKCVVALPKGTNAPLDNASEDKLLFKKNKWLLCHDENESLIQRGAHPGIHGKNFEIRY